MMTDSLSDRPNFREEVLLDTANLLIETKRKFLLCEILEFLTEVEKPPYKDSNIADLHKTLRRRASYLLHRVFDE